MVDCLHHVHQTVARQADLYPRDTHGGKLFQTGQVGVGIEIIASRAAAVGVGVRDVDSR